MRLDFARNLYREPLRIDRVALAVALAVLFVIAASDLLARGAV
jgi:hypothetical protein